METLEEKYKNNSDLINCLDASEWVELLKEITLLYLPFPKDEEIEAVENIKNISLNYSELGLVGITMYTNALAYKDIRIKLSIHSIIISRQQGHTNFEELYELPIVIIRKILKSKLCN